MKDEINAATLAAVTIITKIVTHFRPHFDEMLAIWLLRRFGGKKMPGVREAPVCFVDAGIIPPQGADVLEREAGELWIGVGGGRFDEHPNATRERAQNECAATLVANALGIQDAPQLQEILRFARKKDLNGGGHAFDIGKVAEQMHRYQPPEMVMNWVFCALDVKFRTQKEFWGVTAQEFKNNATLTTIDGPSGENITLATITSDNEDVAKFARMSGCDVIVLGSSRGLVQIFRKGTSKIDLTPVTRTLRIEERRVNNLPDPEPPDWTALSAEGRVDGAEVWHFFISQNGNGGTQSILNGSLSAPNATPTKLGLARVSELVQITLGRGFEPTRANRCIAKVCSHGASNPCPWFAWGLERCRAIHHK